MFRAGLGTLKRIKDTMIDENPQAKFHKVYLDSYSPCAKVDAELDHLERKDVLSKVPWSEWGMPIVPNIKKCGTVKVCGDFQVTINHLLKVNKYPYLKSKHVLPCLQRDRHLAQLIFCKLAYRWQWKKIQRCI